MLYINLGKYTFFLAFAFTLTFQKTIWNKKEYKIRTGKVKRSDSKCELYKLMFTFKINKIYFLFQNLWKWLLHTSYCWCFYGTVELCILILFLIVANKNISKFIKSNIIVFSILSVFFCDLFTFSFFWFSIFLFIFFCKIFFLFYDGTLIIS